MHTENTKSRRRAIDLPRIISNKRSKENEHPVASLRLRRFGERRRCVRPDRQSRHQRLSLSGDEAILRREGGGVAARNRAAEAAIAMEAAGNRTRATADCARSEEH